MGWIRGDVGPSEQDGNGNASVHVGEPSFSKTRRGLGSGGADANTWKRSGKQWSERTRGKGRSEGECVGDEMGRDPCHASPEEGGHWMHAHVPLSARFAIHYGVFRFACHREAIGAVRRRYGHV